MLDTYLLVCEGPTDMLVIKEIAKIISQQIGKEIQINLLAPAVDATGKFPPHGWEEVRSWCDQYGNVDIDPNDHSLCAVVARRKNWRSQIAISQAKGLIIHLDTDIAHLIYGMQEKFTGGSIAARKRFCERAVLTWLRESSAPKEIHILLATYSTETWLLSTIERNNPIFDDLLTSFNFEEIDNPEQRLLNFGLESYVDENGRQRLKKNKAIYERYAKRIANNLTTVRQECREVDLLCQRF